MPWRLHGHWFNSKTVLDWLRGTYNQSSRHDRRSGWLWRNAICREFFYRPRTEQIIDHRRLFASQNHRYQRFWNLFKWCRAVTTRNVSYSVEGVFNARQFCHKSWRKVSQYHFDSLWGQFEASMGQLRHKSSASTNKFWPRKDIRDIRTRILLFRIESA